MKTATISWFLIMLLALFVNTGCAQSESKTTAEETYVCPPCGHDCLKTTYKKPGSCGECGMALVTLASVQNGTTPAHAHSENERLKVAILIFDEVQIIDYTGPYEVFGGAGFDVFTVSKKGDEITTVYGMRVDPKYSFADCPDPDILLVPGGDVIATQNDSEVRAWLRKTADKAEHVLSVCNGAFILAKTGLLNGLSATTTRHLTGGLANAAPNITVVENVRWVDNGKIVTAGGLSAGMDAALHVVSKIRGMEYAETLAYRLEYFWQKDNKRIEPSSL